MIASVLLRSAPRPTSNVDTSFYVDFEWWTSDDNGSTARATFSSGALDADTLANMKQSILNAINGDVQKAGKATLLATQVKMWGAGII